MSSNKDNVYHLTMKDMMESLEEEKATPDRPSDTKLLTIPEVDGIIGKPPTFPEKGRAASKKIWYEFARRHTVKLAPHHRDIVLGYVSCYRNFLLLEKEIDDIPPENRFHEAYKELWTRRKEFIAQMQSYHKMMVGMSQGGRPTTQKAGQ